MSLLDKVGLPTKQIADLKNKIKNPFTQEVTLAYRGQDFPFGFLIEELDFEADNNVLNTVQLIGNMMPQVPFKFGGTQRIKKEFYAGHSEPAVHILGPQEDNIVIQGELKDKKLPKKYYGFATELQELIDAIRIRGNLCRFVLGDWERYGFIESSEFDLRKKSHIKYDIDLSIVGFNAPKNAKILEQERDVPFDINKDLIDRATALTQQNLNKPLTVPRSVSDILDGLTSDVAGAIATVTDFVDTVFTTVQDIRKSVQRALGLVKHLQNTVNNYKRTIGGFDPFDPGQSLTGRYENASYYSSLVTGSAALSGLIARYRAQFIGLTNQLPAARHLVKDGETLQSISVKHYGTADNWAEIQEFNKLATTELTSGRLLEIPRLNL